MCGQLDVSRYEDRSVELIDFLSKHDTGCLATSDGANPFAAVAFFVYEFGNLVFKSRTASGHSTHLRSNVNASFAVYNHGSTYDAKYGAQLLGTASRIREPRLMQRAVELYGERFAGSAAKLPSIEELCSDGIASTFYHFAIARFKIIDEDKTCNRTMLAYEDFHHPPSA